MSVIATLMSFLYSLIGLGLSVAKATGALSHRLSFGFPCMQQSPATGSATSAAGMLVVLCCP